MQEEFPYWEHLHGYWHTLPNYNPLTVASMPDQDLEGGVLELFKGGATAALLDLGLEGEPSVHPAFATANSLTPEEQAKIDMDPDADAEGEGEDMADVGVHFFYDFIYCQEIFTTLPFINFSTPWIKTESFDCLHS